MTINTDINIIGSILDLNIISNMLEIDGKEIPGNNYDLSTTKLKTTRSLKRYTRAIKNTLIYFKNQEIKDLFIEVFVNEALSEDCLMILFLNVSVNNDLLNYFNQNIYFPAYFSNRTHIQKDEIIAAINDLKQSEDAVKKWSDSTIDILSRKYLALLQKFNLLGSGRNKPIKRTIINDKQLILFIYCLLKIETKTNIIESKWLIYCLLEKEIFKERVLQKKFMKYFRVMYTGNAMKLEPHFLYKDVYYELTNS